jgi:hypothetical protein
MLVLLLMGSERQMFTAEQYRAKAVEYAGLREQTDIPREVREFNDLERSFSVLADNEEWLADNYKKTIHAPGERGGNAPVAEEEHILRCLGASVLMLWNVIPTKLQRELFDTAGTMGDVLSTPALRGRIARFLHNHKGDEDPGR